MRAALMLPAACVLVAAVPVGLGQAGGGDRGLDADIHRYLLD